MLHWMRKELEVGYTTRDTARVLVSFLIVTILLAKVISLPQGDSVPATETKLSLGHTPIADAGFDQTAFVGEEVRFDGSESYDLDSPLLLDNETTVNDDVNNAEQVAPSLTIDEWRNVHVLWSDDRNGNHDVFYSVLNESVGVFSSNVKVNDDMGDRSQYAADMDVDYEGVVHVLTHDKRNSRILSDVYYASLPPGASGFGKNIMVNDDGPGNAYQAATSLDVDLARNVHAVWWDSRLGPQGDVDVFYAQKAHDKSSFSTNVRVNEDIQEYQASPFVLVDDELAVHVVWNDHRYSTGWKIYYANSTDGGQTFYKNVKVNDLDGMFRMRYPELAFSRDGEIVVIWYDERDGNGNIYTSRLKPGESSFTRNERVNDVIGTVRHTTLSFVSDTSGRFHLAWEDSRDGNADIYYTFITPDGHVSTSSRVNIVTDGYQISPSIAVDPEGNPHFVWLSNASGDYDTIYLGSSGQDLTYEWDFDDGSHGSGVKPTHTYSSSGIYNVTLTVTDTEGASDSDNCVITVLSVNQPPIANGGGPYYVDEGSSLELNGSASLDPNNDTLYYRWDLDNDGTWDTSWSLSPKVTNTWMDDGTYVVILQVMDVLNETDMDNVTVHVEDLSPTAGFNWSPEPQDEGSPVQFSDSSTSYPDAILSWSWTFGDGGTDSGKTPFHTFGDNGNYVVTLTVVDDDGSSDSVSHGVTISNVAPTAFAGDDKEGFEVSTFAFNGSFYDPGTLDTHIIEWDFDYDGATFDVEAIGETVSHTWIDDFDGYVALRVTDDDGGVGIDTAHVLVKNVPPTVELEVLPIEVDASLRIAGEKWHDVTIELYEDGILLFNGTIVRYPGSPDDQMLDMSQLQIDVSKRYTATVRYTPEDDPINGQPNGANPCWIILTFEDGQELWLHHTFNVQHPEGYVWDVDLTAAILSHGITFKATAFDPGADDLTFHWDFGEGTNVTSIYPNTNGTYPVNIVDTVTHVFPGSGTYMITVTVKDDDGGMAQISYALTI
jgi:PKD repeat protein